jgi:opacity protein-like surface antigen
MARLPLRTLLSTALAASVALAAPAFAQDGGNDRFTLRLSAFNPKADLRFSTQGTATDGTETEAFAGAQSFDTGRDWRPRAAFNWSLGDRHNIGANYYDYDRDNDWDTDGGLVTLPELPGESLDVPEATASGKVKFALASVYYAYDVVDTDTFEWGLGLGATYASLEGRGQLDWAGSDDVEAGSASFGDKTNGWSPAVHTRLGWRPADRWRVDLEAQYMDTEWGNFIDERGHFERAGLVVEYAVTDSVGVHVGYDWFRLKLRDDYTGTITPPPELEAAPVDVDGTITGQLKAHGPMAGVTFRF